MNPVSCMHMTAAERTVTGNLHVQEVIVPDDQSLADEDLCKLLQQHLGVEVAGFFARPADSGHASSNRQQAAALQPRSHAAGQPGGQAITLDWFVQQTGPLLELEQAAEIGQVSRAAQ